MIRENAGTSDKAIQRFKSLPEFAESIAALSPAARKAANDLDGTDDVIERITESANGSKRAFKQFGEMLITAFTFWAISTAIDLAVKGIEQLANAQMIANEKAREQAASTKEKADAMVEESRTIEDLISKYEELRTAEYLDPTSRGEVVNIQKQITDLVGDQAANLDLVNGKLDDQLNILQRISLVKAKEAQDSLVAARIAAGDVASTDIGASKVFWQGGYDYVGKRDVNAENILRQVEGMLVSGGWGTTSVYTGAGADRRIKILSDAINALKSDSEYDWQHSSIFSTLQKELDEAKKSVEEYNDAERAVVDNSILISHLQNLADGVVVNSSNAFKEYRKSLIDAVMADDSLTSSVFDVRKAVDDFLAKEFPLAAAAAAGAISDISITLQGVASDLASFTDKFDLIASVRDEIKETGNITSGTLNSLIEKYPQLEAAVVKYQLGIIKSGDLMKELQDAYDADYQNFTNTLSDKLFADAEYYQYLLKNQGSSVDEINQAYGVDLANFKTLEEAKLAIQASILAKMSANMQKYAGMSAEQLANAAYGLSKANSDGRYNQQLKDIAALYNAYKDADKKLSSLSFSGIDYNPGSYSNSASKGSPSDKHLEAYQTAVKQLQFLRDTDVISEAEYYRRLEALANQYLAGRSKYIDEYRSVLVDLHNFRKKQLEEQRDAELEALKTSTEARKKAAKEQYEAEKKSYEAKKKALQDELKAYKDVIDAAKEKLRQEEAAYDHNKEVTEINHDIYLIEEELSGLSLDDSAKANARKKELAQDLADRQADLAEKQYKYSNDLQEGALDREYDRMETHINSEIDLIEAALQRIADGYDALLESISASFDSMTAAIKAQYENMISSMQAAASGFALPYLSGQKNSQVGQIQQELINQGYLSGSGSQAADNIWGAQTEKAYVNRSSNVNPEAQGCVA